MLEHSKTEVFHFDRSSREGNGPPLVLEGVQGVEDLKIEPKAIWRYLGFFFDTKLMFREHVRFYSTKSLTTVKAMGMLGNSTRGLSPSQKRKLYHTCVLPIATYGYRLWLYKGARNCKGNPAKRPTKVSET